jgi:hypothetical protein
VKHRSFAALFIFSSWVCAAPSAFAQSLVTLSVSAYGSQHFSYRIGDAPPAPAVGVMVQSWAQISTWVGGVTFTAQASSQGDWLSVSPTEGRTLFGGPNTAVNLYLVLTQQ